MCLLAAAAALAGLGWTASGRMRVGGDEPHYLIIAASVLRDFDLDVRNNYEQNAATHEIAGPIRPHALMRTGGPQHMPGMGILLSVPFGLGGIIGARVGLALLLVSVLAVAVYRWNRTFLRASDAGLATLGLMACTPVMFGASQMYPDLAGGVAVFALVGWLVGGDRSARAAWCVYWLVAGLLCWLHVKFYAPSAVLAAVGVWRLWGDSPRYTLATYAMFAVLFLTGPMLFGAFSIPAFGDLLGGRGGAELNTDPARALELFLGLHLDQVHGMFIQQPLLLPGLAALGWMLRRRHPLTLPWLVLYASLTVPNALQQFPYGGHVAPAGRFGWTAMWLWLVPLGVAAGSLGSRVTPVARLAVLAGIGYQAILASSWVSEPQRLFNGLFAPDVWQPSLFPPAVMLSLPKLGPHADISYAPNVIWALAAASVLAAGFLRAPRLRYVPLALVAACFPLVLPIEDTLNRGSSVLRRYEAEHFCRSEVTAVGCRQDATRRPALSGPWIRLDPGAYVVVASWRARPAARLHGGTLRVVAGRGRTTIVRHDFELPAARGFTAVPFDLERAAVEVEFQMSGARGFEVDYIDLRRAGSLAPRGEPAASGAGVAGRVARATSSVRSSLCTAPANRCTEVCSSASSSGTARSRWMVPWIPGRQERYNGASGAGLPTASPVRSAACTDRPAAVAGSAESTGERRANRREPLREPAP